MPDRSAWYFCEFFSFVDILLNAGYNPGVTDGIGSGAVRFLNGKTVMVILLFWVAVGVWFSALRAEPTSRFNWRNRAPENVSHGHLESSGCGDPVSP